MAVANADLSFATRVEAKRTAEQMSDENLVHQATGIIAERHQVGMVAARNRLAASAERAGISDVQAAKALLATFLP